jgi:hypothetical protein
MLAAMLTDLSAMCGAMGWSRPQERSMFHRIILSLLTIVMLTSSSLGAWAKERFALVLGNSNYQAITTLANPVRDAKSITNLLKTAGFDVTTALDLGQTDMRRAVADFAAKLADKSKDTVALVYFAGHGIQVDGKNYLLPVDAKLKAQADVALEAVKLADVMNVLNSVPSKTRIVILDACRNNPFAELADNKSRGLIRVSNRGSGDLAAKGLAIVNAPAGTLVAYSTSPGATADDGAGQNSPFTAAFVKAAQTPGAGIETVLQNVRLAVHNQTQGRQTPWEVAALTSRFSFFPGQGGGVANTPAIKSDAAWRNELRTLTPERAYQTVIVQNNVTVYQIFLEIHASSPWSQVIQGLMSRRLEMQAWFHAVTLNSAEAFQAFLRLYPNSDLASTADRLRERAARREALARSLTGNLGLKPRATTRTVVKEVVKKVYVASPPIIKTVVKEVPVHQPPVVRTVVREVKVPVYRTKYVKVPVFKTVIRKVYVTRPCRCSRPRHRPRMRIHVNPQIFLRRPRHRLD